MDECVVYKIVFVWGLDLVDVPSHLSGVSMYAPLFNRSKNATPRTRGGECTPYDHTSIKTSITIEPAHTHQLHVLVSRARAVVKRVGTASAARRPPRVPRHHRWQCAAARTNSGDTRRSVRRSRLAANAQSVLDLYRRWFDAQLVFNDKKNR